MTSARVSFSREARLVTAGLLGGALVTCVVATVVSASGPALMAGVAIGCLVPVSIPMLLRADYDMFEPPSMLALAVFLGVAVRTPYILFADSEAARSWLLLGRDPAILLPALVAIAVGLSMLTVGYLLPVPSVPLGRLAGVVGGRWTKRRVSFVAGLCVLVSAVSIVLYVQRLGVAGVLLEQVSAKRRLSVDGAGYQYAALGYYRWGASLVGYAFLLVFARWATRGERLWSRRGAFMLLLGALAAIFPIFVSSRGGVLNVAVIAVICWHYLRSPIGVRTVAGVTAAFLLIVAALGGLRAVGTGRADSLGAYVASGELVESVVVDRHWLDVSKTAHIMDAVPTRLEPGYGRTLVTWVVAPVPRTMWPEKPIVRVGQELGTILFERSIDVTGVPPGIIAELYWNFGWSGLVVGMLCLGVVLSVAYRSFRPYLSRPGAALLYAVVLLYGGLHIASSDVSGVVLSLIRTCLTLLVFLFVISNPFEPGVRPRTMAEHS